VQEDVQRYVRNKRLDALVTNIVEELIKYRPNYVATYIFQSMVQKFPDETKATIATSKVVVDLAKK
jgi:hypothetical protein